MLRAAARSGRRPALCSAPRREWARCAHSAVPMGARGLASSADDPGLPRDDPDIHLRRDIKALGRALGDAIRNDAKNGEATYATVEQLRSLARRWRSMDPSGFGAPAKGEAQEKLQEVVDLTAGLSSATIREAARAFTHFLALSNTAESHHRVRKVIERNVRSGSLTETVRDGDYSDYPAQPLNTTLGTVQRLLGTHGEGDEANARASPDEIFEALCTQSVEIVLTAHPTEVTRRTVVQRHREIEQSLVGLDHPAERWNVKESHANNLQRQVDALWWTDEIRREKPTPWKEARHGLEIVATSMWHAVPDYLRRIDAEMQAAPGIEKPLPPDVAPVRFASWMGGDRDGNPNVTPEITKEVVLMSRLRGASLVKEALVSLMQEVCVSADKATPELLAILPKKTAGQAAGKRLISERDPVKHYRGRTIDRSTLDQQPYSMLFNHLESRLDESIKLLERGELRPPPVPEGGLEPLVDSKELIETLMVAYKSLCDVGLTAVADGKLRDLVRQLKCFGLSLLPPDCRNESIRHSEALDAITRYLGLGSYLEWDEQTRQMWLLKELFEKRPLLPHCADYASLGVMFDETVCDVLGTFDMIAEIPEESLGACTLTPPCPVPCACLQLR